MRKPTFFLLLAFISFTTQPSVASPKNYIDTAHHVVHVLDGNIKEWSNNKFETDDVSKVQYCIDHDAVNLYMALKIPDEVTQIKIMTQGMKMFIDKKGKRKESTGVEFPIKRPNEGPMRMQGPGSTDMAAIKESVTPWMIFLKTFGLNDTPDKSQLVSTENSINIAFDWDEAGILSIEYRAPFDLLGGRAAVDGKPLAIGWKILGSEEVRRPTVIQSEIIAVPANGATSRAGTGRNSNIALASAGRDFPQPATRRGPDQNFWTTYTPSF